MKEERKAESIPKKKRIKIQLIIVAVSLVSHRAGASCISELKMWLMMLLSTGVGYV